MSAVFIKVLNMSLTAAFVIAVILLIRPLLKKAPPIFAFLLWAVALFRLVCPVSFESALSVLPSAEPVSLISPPVGEPILPTVPQNIALPANSPIAAPNAGAAVSLTDIAAWLWLAGIAIALIYSVISYLKLIRALKNADKASDGVYTSKSVSTALVVGLFRPRIYLPDGLTAKERMLIVSHERAHIRRGDHIVKLIAFAALCLHWFNPLVWLGFLLAMRDMESCCDELALSSLGEGVRADYAASLLRLATKKRLPSASPLAFSEGDTKGRIKRLLNYKKPAFWIIIVCVLALSGAAVLLISNPKPDKNADTTVIGGAVGPTDITISYTDGSSATDPTFSVPAEAPELLRYPLGDGDDTFATNSTGDDRLIRGFSGTHPGLDIAADVGTPIYAAADGVVTEVEESDAGYGYFVVIAHGGGVTTLYAHNSENLVSVGDAVKQGDKIALSGYTGNATGPHVHFEICLNGIPVDPILCVENSEYVTTDTLTKELQALD